MLGITNSKKVPGHDAYLIQSETMKKYIIVAINFALLTSLSFGQTPTENNYAALFCKVWGFLKYHHPSIASGNVNWDSIFVAKVKIISGSKNKIELNNQLNTIIDDAGSVAIMNRTPTKDSLFTWNSKDSILWIEQSDLFVSEVKAKLKNIYHNKHQGLNKYIKIVHNTADYSGENKYANIGFPTEEYRLLFLSRFWNIVNYYAPYKYLIDDDWNNVLIRFIPKFITVKDSVSYYKILLELAKSIQDGHCQLNKSSQTFEMNDLVFGKYTVPFYCAILNDTVIVRNLANDSLNKKAGIEIGDIILKADNIPVQKLIQEKRKYISASNKPAEAHHLSWCILDGQTPEVTLTVKRGNRIFTTSLQRTPSAKRNWGKLVNYTANDVGYRSLGDSTLLIYAMQIWNGNLDTLKALIRKSKAVIFDVRNYPQNDAFYYIVDPFLSEPRVINYITEPIADIPGIFKWIQSPKIGQVNTSPFIGKVVILADERTQSQGEYSCMVLQTIPGAITIGRQTAGADGIVTYIPMGGNLALSYSGYGVFYPDKGQTQRTGIRIDITVPRTTEFIRANRDETLERALKYLKKG